MYVFFTRKGQEEFENKVALKASKQVMTRVLNSVDNALDESEQTLQAHRKMQTVIQLVALAALAFIVYTLYREHYGQ